MKENKYLAIYEVPCVGTVAETFTALNDEAAEEIAWKTSLNEHYVHGGYDLYRIIWEAAGYTHKLIPVIPE